MKRLIMLVVVQFFCVATTYAAIDAYAFPDTETRERYNTLIAELRCPTCLNTNLAGSDAMIAKDLRREVHRLLLEDKTDAQVLSYMLERYGDFILYDPQLNKGTLLLWFGPPGLFLIALFVGFKVATRGSSAATISATEQAEIDHLINQDQTKS